ncbi:unnamed protein product [Parnassius mnemosyne]|uniref:Peptidase S1 domain-containing protein n=1 Tax=Parnassius mnemosyne TaxID=213953 RepID=A0AAV1M048_9NEOP
MEEITNDNNRVIEEGIDSDENDLSYNFINISWDDRSKRSKVAMLLFLIAIFFSIMALVINNFVVHYKNFNFDEFFNRGEINCNLVKVDEYRYAARIHSVSSRELICVGAVINENSVLANEVCLKSGPVRLHVGSPTDQRCKKGFPVDAVELIPHDGVISKNLVLLMTYKKIIQCVSIIKIGVKMDWHVPAYVIGRPFHGERSLSRQLVTLNVHDNNTYNGQLVNNLRNNKVICVKYLSRCPVRAGDLLVQKGRLLGLASTSTQRRENNKLACFANVSNVHEELKQLDVNIDLNK